jgi:hypothetical protein
MAGREPVSPAWMDEDHLRVRPFVCGHHREKREWPEFVGVIV